MKTLNKKKPRVRGSLWKNRKYTGLYRGKYRRVGGEREFLLVNEARPKDKVIPFNAPELAKQAGWSVAKPR